VPLLEGKGITRFFGGLAAISNVDFHVDPGEIVGLIGPNGAGKTTLFNMVSGALSPKSGTIMFKERNITGLRPDRICRMGIARTFQSVKVFGHMTVFDNVKVASLFGVGNKSTTGNRPGGVAAILEFVDLYREKDILAADLTLVRQKQLEVARALATQPELLLLDEIMAGLNVSEVTQAMDIVKRIRQSGIAVLMIEHVMKAIMGMCDRIIVLHHGEKIAEGTPQAIAANKTVVEVYLGE
jgi:branched-chain amino acid transport system ATP-binding protein